MKPCVAHSADAPAHSLLKALAPAWSARATPFLLGISGLQGSGKSTLAQALVAAAGTGVAVALSLDDVYLGRAARRELAAGVHPLFVTRGVPGTHDLDQLESTLAALALASAQHPVRLPRFDKGRDEPAPSSQWPCIAVPPRLIVLEGWCLGVPAQAEAALAEPVNALERDEDPDGRWRHHVNAQLAGPYAALWRRLDHLLLLQAPGFEVVERWRAQQEEALHRRGAPEALAAPALRRFIAHYERLSRHALDVLADCADTVLQLDPERRVVAVEMRGEGGDRRRICRPIIQRPTDC